MKPECSLPFTQQPATYSCSKPNQYLSHPTTLLLNFSKPKTYFIYQQLSHSEILCSAYIAFMCLFGSQNKQRLFLCTALTYRFL